MAAAMVGGTRAWARNWVTWQRWAVLVSSSISNRSVSVVRPYGPGAAHFRARGKLRRIMVSGMSAGQCGSKARTSGASGACSCWGRRRAGSRSSWRVYRVLGARARGPAASACRAANRSPKWSQYCARSVRLVSSGPAASSRGLFVLLLVVLVWPACWRSWSHSPTWNCWIRCFQSFLRTERVPGLRWRSARGNRNYSFHALWGWHDMISSLLLMMIILVMVMIVMPILMSVRHWWRASMNPA